jgi:hypothetical protein
MSRRIPEFEGFSDPIENFTKIPNEFFELLKFLKGGEIKLLLYIIRMTVGWQRRFHCISIAEFSEELGMSKKTILDSSKTLRYECDCILRYQRGNGSQRETFFFLNTSINSQIVQAIENGHIDIEQAEKINTLNSHSDEMTELRVDNPKKKPNKGVISPPDVDKLGSVSSPSRKKTRDIKENLKEISSFFKNPKSVLVGVIRKHFS